MMENVDEIWGENDNLTANRSADTTKEDYINGIPVKSLPKLYSNPMEWINGVEKFKSDIGKYTEIYKGEPNTGISVIMFNSLKASPPVNHYDKWVIMGYLALGSIGGKKRVFHTNYKMMFARMAGYRSSEDVSISDIFSKLGRNVKSEAVMRRYGADLKDRIMVQFDKMHIYTDFSVHGIYVMQHDETPREDALIELGMLAKTKTKKRKDLKKTINIAKAKVKRMLS